MHLTATGHKHSSHDFGEGKKKWKLFQNRGLKKLQVNLVGFAVSTMKDSLVRENINAVER